MLKTTEQGLKDLMRGCALSDIFPQLRKNAVLEAAVEREGIVIRYSSRQMQIEFAQAEDSQEPAIDDSPLKGQRRNEDSTLLWIRLIVEKHGGEEKSYALLMAEILPESRSRYEGRPTHSL